LAAKVIKILQTAKYRLIVIKAFALSGLAEGFWLQAKGFSATSERVFGYKRKVFRL
jgi:hypothetical protein